MEPKQTKVSSFLSSLLPEVQTEVQFNQANLIQAGAVIFIAAVAIIFAWFTLKKILS